MQIACPHVCIPEIQINFYLAGIMLTLIVILFTIYIFSKLNRISKILSVLGIILLFSIVGIGVREGCQGCNDGKGPIGIQIYNRDAIPFIDNSYTY